jgi:pyridoxamine 5'-phosphate oxidase
MTKAEIIAFINENPLCFLATTEGDTPHVRGMRAFRADENGIILYTAKEKAVYQQLTRNPKAEICFYDFNNVIQVRVSGRMELVQDLELKKEIGSTRPNVKSRVEKEGNDWLVIFRLRNGMASVWSLKTINTPKTLISL